MIRITEADIATIYSISLNIPELIAPHPPAEYERRMAGGKALILAAYADDIPAGFKVGYDKYRDGSFYSWMGGVVPSFRRYGVARALAAYQESWARAQGFSSIRFKTRNRHKAMLLFALSNEFSIVDFEKTAELPDHRILLEKPL